jgi:hypothetical protein
MQREFPMHLHEQIAAVAPMRGLVIGNEADKATWVVDFDPLATTAEKNAARAIINAADPNADVPPHVISGRQFYIQLFKQSVITNTEARAAINSGTVPAAFMAIVQTMPADQQFEAELNLAGTAVQDRTGTLIKNTIAPGMGWSNQYLLDLWVAAAKL